MAAAASSRPHPPALTEADVAPGGGREVPAGRDGVGDHAGPELFGGRGAEEGVKKGAGGAANKGEGASLHRTTSVVAGMEVVCAVTGFGGGGSGLMTWTRMSGGSRASRRRWKWPLIRW